MVPQKVMSTQEVFKCLYSLSDDPDWILFLVDYQKEVLASLFAGHQRLGQALYNSLPGIRLPGLFAGSQFDPFFDDDVIPIFIDRLFEWWKE